MRYAIIDIGSNTVRMNIYNVEPEIVSEKVPRTLSLLLGEKETLGLVTYVKKRVMTDEGIFKLIEVIDRFRTLAESVNADKMICFATASLRNIDNPEEVIRFVKERTACQIDLVTGENEALLDFEGIKYNFGTTLQSGIMMDMGGGSTELLGFIDGLAVRAVSRPFGCLSLYKKFVAGIFPKKEERKEIVKFVEKEMQEVEWLHNYGDTVYLVGGTGRALGKLHNEIYKTGKKENGYVMQIEEINYIGNLLKDPKENEIKLMIRAIPDRLHTIIPGLTAYLKLLEYSGCKKVIISAYGVREGYLQTNVLRTEMQ